MPSPKPLRLVPAVHRAAHRVALYVEKEARLGISQGEAHILTHLLVLGNSTVAQIHAAFGHRRSTLTSILDRLAHRSFIRRDSSASDRRTFIISLTAEGRKAARRALRSLQEFESQVMAQVSRTQLNGFTAVIDTLSHVGTKPRHQS